MQGDSAHTPESSGQDGQWQYRQDEGGVPVPTQESYTPPSEYADDDLPAEVRWTASEYAAHHKTPAWYAAFAAISIAVVALVVLVRGDFMSIFVALLFIAMFGYSAGRQPQTRTYVLDHKGLSIGAKFYPYADFKSFDVVHEGAFPTLIFAPLKRYVLPVSIYYDPAEEDMILSMVMQYLPHEERRPDVFDSLSHRLRF